MCNKGENISKGQASNGMNASTTVQVADVNKVLASTAKVCDAGNTQAFAKNGGWVIGGDESK